MLGASAESGRQSPARCALIREMINLFVLHCCYYAHKPELCKNFPAEIVFAGCKHKIKKKILSLKYF